MPAKNTVAALASLQAGVLAGAHPTQAYAGSCGTTILRGRGAVAAMAPLMVELCKRTGQTGAMDDLALALASPDALAKTPCLVLCGLRAGLSPLAGQACDLSGAVLLYEYRIGGIGTCVFATDDTSGERTVVADPDCRTQIAQQACSGLLAHGAAIVLVSLEAETEACHPPAPGGPAAWWMSRVRSVPRYLPLAPTMEATLASLGNDTRRNLRRYRRRAEEELGAQFSSSIRMTWAEFTAMNRASSHPVEEAFARWRYRSLHQTARPILCGLRGSDGRWLSLIGGRRRDGIAEIGWQMNLAGMPRYSLSTAMRAFVLEHEIALGTRRLVFEGGTPHPMRHSFVAAPTVDVVAVRSRSAIAWAVSRLAGQVFPPKNFLAGALRDPNHRWTYR
jgi:hypothetical protein